MATQSHDSLWVLLRDIIPKPEIVEIMHIIGSSTIETNSALWDEVISLNEILSEMAMLEVDTHLMHPKDLDIPLPEAPSPHGHSSARLSIHDASPPRANHNDSENIRCCSFDPYEFLGSIKRELNIDSIQMYVVQIREAFEMERNDLEKELLRLNRIMDGEVDMISAARSPPSTPLSRGPTTSSRCLDCGEILLAERANVETICQKCRRHKKLHGRLPKSMDKSMFASQQQEDGKFRNRIKAAMDDHHFLEDFR